MELVRLTGINTLIAFISLFIVGTSYGLLIVNEESIVVFCFVLFAFLFAAKAQCIVLETLGQRRTEIKEEICKQILPLLEIRSKQGLKLELTDFSFHICLHYKRLQIALYQLWILLTQNSIRVATGFNAERVIKYSYRRVLSNQQVSIPFLS